ncbi:MAG: peptidoglycan DD-metalloendopeptidase family protein [Actinomycetota bacterium]
MLRLPALLVACLLATLLVAASATPALARSQADEPGAYRPPADAPIVDPFRPPAGPYGSGNRGIDLGTERGDEVWAARAGTVVFAGAVAGTLHVVIAHDDGLRTSYSFLGTITVRVGDRVESGTRVGTAGGTTHFGVRAGDAYLDPEVLLAQPLRVRLVPTDTRTAAEEAAKQRIIDTLFGRPGDGSAVLRALGTGVGWARAAASASLAGARATVAASWQAVVAEVAALHQELLTYAHYLHELNVLPHLGRILQAAHRWWDHLDECTPPNQPLPPPPAPAERRIVVLVGGLGSTSEDAAVYDVDTAALGYGDDEVVRFSYSGEATYDTDDTTVDIRASAARLVALLRVIRRREPGVPVDVIAHSQGGVVARTAMLDIDPLDPRDPDIGTMITLGSPHSGADLATWGSQLGQSTVGGLALTVGEAVTGVAMAPTSVSTGQLAETSPFMRWLNDQPPPDHVEIRSIAARGDLVVPAGRSHLDGATNTIVGLDGVTAHDRLPGSAEAEREMRLALAGMAPTCEGFASFMYDHIVSDVIGWGEDALGFATSLAARRLDAGLPSPTPVHPAGQPIGPPPLVP